MQGQPPDRRHRPLARISWVARHTGTAEPRHTGTAEPRHPQQEHFR